MIKTLIPLAAFILICPVSGNAEQVTYAFSTTVSAVNSNTNGFPSSLSGIGVGDTITGTLSYDTASSAVANGFGGLFAEATLYSLDKFSLTANIGGSIFDNWGGSPAAFVWNNSSVGADGLIFTNITSSATQQFQIGNIALSTGTFTDETLPSELTAVPMVFTLGLGGSPNFWIEGNVFTLTPKVVPVPTAVWLFGSGIIGLIGAAGRKKL